MLRKHPQIGDIVYRNADGGLGTLITTSPDDGTVRFLPAETKTYSPELLEVVTAKDVRATALPERILYLKLKSNVWGHVIETHEINDGEYIIMKIVHKNNRFQPLYHTFLNFKDTCHCYESLDKALIGILDYKYQGNNSQAGIMFERMLEMDKKNIDPLEFGNGE